MIIRQDIIKYISQKEGISPESLEEKLDSRKVVILANKDYPKAKIVAVGEGLTRKVNVNIGTSPDIEDIELELKKVNAAQEAGADTIMDLSCCGDLDKIRREIMEASKVPVGSVPIYQAAVESPTIKQMTIDSIIKVVKKHAKDGIDFMTIHAGLKLENLYRLKNIPRVLGIVSRGGTILAEWMISNNRENPFYEKFDEILAIAKEYGVVLSLGSSFRPGAIADATDYFQISELLVLGELTQRAHKEGVGVIIEGPGHVPINQIPMNIKLQKTICRSAPFYVLGPLVTDIACRYDHISAAIGAAIAGWCGADFLCYVTPSEHLKLPSVEDVIQGTVAMKIAAHAADIALGIKSAHERDMEHSIARSRLDWKKQKESAIYPPILDELFPSGLESCEGIPCSMCGKLCAIKLYQNVSDNLSNR